MVVFGQELCGVTHSGGDHVEDRTGEIGRRFLGDQGDAQALPAHDFAAVGSQLPRKELQQGGFPRAVPPQEADAVSLFDLQGGSVKNRRTAEGDADVPKCYE